MLRAPYRPGSPRPQMAVALGWAEGQARILPGTGDPGLDAGRLLREAASGLPVVLKDAGDPALVYTALSKSGADLIRLRLYQQTGQGLMRHDADGVHLMDLSVQAPAEPLAKDFAPVLAGQRLLRRLGQAEGEGYRSPTDPWGRARNRRWIAAQGGSRAGGVAMFRVDAMTRLFMPLAASNEPVLYLHGGGLVHYDLETYTPLLTHLSRSLRAPVFAVEYRKCPEVAATAVLDDLMLRIEGVMQRERISRIMGDSIGGLLALYAALRVVPGRFTRAGLLYPFLSMSRGFGSHERHGQGLLLEQADMRWFRSMIAPVMRSRGFDPLTLPTEALQGLNIRLHAAGCDVLADEAEAFADRHPAVTLHRHPALPHDFALYAPRLASARAALDRIAADFNAL